MSPHESAKNLSSGRISPTAGNEPSKLQGVIKQLKSELQAQKSIVIYQAKALQGKVENNQEVRQLKNDLKTERKKNIDLKQKLAQAEKSALASHEMVVELTLRMKHMQTEIDTKVRTKLPAEIDQLINDPQVIHELG